MLNAAMNPAKAMLGMTSVDREFRYTEADFRAIATILRSEAGISLPAGKAPLVYARLAKRLRALQLDDFASYIKLLENPDERDERSQMVTALTTNVTRFFREPHHFEHLRTHALAPLLADARKGARVRLWSSACSTGQEPYSIAAVLAAMLPETSKLDVKILATDIDPNVIQQAKAGHYDSIDGVPSELRHWFQQDGSGWQVANVLREMVTFRHLNLNAIWPMRGPFDAVFCRNVAIYFDHDIQATLWMSFANVMRPNGYFYIGHSERISGRASDCFDNVGITTYRRRADGQ